MNETHNHNGFSVNERHPDGGNAPYNPLQGGLVNSKPQPLARAVSSDSDGTEKTQRLIEQAREQINPLAERASVVLRPTPSN
jgi:hypothetical protein